MQNFTPRDNYTGEGPIKILGISFHTDKEIMENVNYGEVLNRMEAVLKVWKGRKLSLIGKIEIVNSLVASKLAYLFTMLPTPSNFFFKFIKGMFRDFLWDEKIPRVKFEKLIQKIERGGLKLVDIESKERALKSKWIQNIKGKKNAWFYMFLPIKDQRMWSLNLNQEDINKFGIRDKMSKDILKAWYSHTFQIPVEKDDILTQKMVGNSLIKRANKPIMAKKVIESSVKYIYQLRSKKNYAALMDFEELKENYIVLFDELMYNSIKTAIPLVWKSMIKFEQVLGYTIMQEECKEETVKEIYWKLVEAKNPTDACRILWEKELEKVITEENWSNLFLELKHITNSTKLKYFQYKCLRRILTTNVLRAKWNNNISPKCTFCNKEKETPKHLFWKCPIVNKFINAVKRWIRHFIDKNFELDYATFMLNN